ncbi:hypothetical protein D6851_02825 [Altericroceibacterium spongiae]|uniref:Lipoprotein n=1 Tax=Altericroceibacterium spongiae TaxID=2320269 RepID=A0A420ERW7_9SPHN|nr:hypothetical protein [Altericroceibacterium spongiae]RKF23418.1 hypothetical protein D6851_02825 [Altericroceibacterium spongiae]
MRVALLGAVILLAGCHKELTPEEQADKDRRDIAMIEKAQQSARPPLTEITPDSITYVDIEEHDLSGSGCNYAPGTSLGTRVIAQPEVAYMKIDGKMTRFARDIGARELPLGTWSKYDGLEYSLRLKISGEGRPAGNKTTNYDGSVILRDAFNRVVYDGSGLVQCSA